MSQYITTRQIYVSSVSHKNASIRTIDSDSVLMIDVALFHTKRGFDQLFW